MFAVSKIGRIPVLLLSRISSIVAWNDCVDSECLCLSGVRGKDCFTANKSLHLFCLLSWQLYHCR